MRSGRVPCCCCCCCETEATLVCLFSSGGIIGVATAELDKDTETEIGEEVSDFKDGNEMSVWDRAVSCREEEGMWEGRVIAENGK